MSLSETASIWPFLVVRSIFYRPFYPLLVLHPHLALGSFYPPSKCPSVRKIMYFYQAMPSDKNRAAGRTRKYPLLQISTSQVPPFTRSIQLFLTNRLCFNSIPTFRLHQTASRVPQGCLIRVLESRNSSNLGISIFKTYPEPKTFPCPN